MEALKVRIQSKADAQKGVPAIDDVDYSKVRQTKDLTVAILEGGMASGATSIMFALKFENGETCIAECSGKHLEALYQSYQGAQERFRYHHKNQ